MSERKQIGWFILNEEKSMTKLYEYAAYYTNILVPPGKYPIYSYVFDKWNIDGTERKEVGWQNYISFKGICTGEYIGNVTESFIGSEVKYSAHIYGYQLPDEVLKGTVELLPEYELVEFDIEREDYKAHVIRICETLSSEEELSYDEEELEM